MSEEWDRFNEAMKAIVSTSPEEVKCMREQYPMSIRDKVRARLRGTSRAQKKPPTTNG